MKIARGSHRAAKHSGRMSWQDPRIADGQGDIESARRLFLEYQEFLGFSLEFQGFAVELQEIASMYGPPTGRLWLAEEGGAAVGCVAVRSLESGVAELKRLYVTGAARRAGHGRRLMAAAVAGARDLGYQRIWLDTIPRLVAARALYNEFGFHEIAPYNDNPQPGVTFMERVLVD